MKRFYLLSVISLFSAGISAQEITGGERTLSADSIITSDARLDSIYQSLPEVMIIGERPVVKASQGKLVYDLPQLIRDQYHHIILPLVYMMFGVLRLFLYNSLQK